MPAQSPNRSIRLTGTSYAVLGLIGLRGEATPYELKQLLEESVANFWPIQHTTFYAEPARLAGAGYLSENQEQRGRRRKLYRLTDRGREALSAWVAATDFTPPQIRDEQVLKIFLGGDPVALLGPRLEWHRTKLGELEGYLESGRSAGGPQGVERSLAVGTLYHRLLIQALTAFLEGGAGELDALQGAVSRMGARRASSPAGSSRRRASPRRRRAGG